MVEQISFDKSKSAAFVRSTLKQLGLEVPDDATLEAAVRAAIGELKAEKYSDPAQVKYMLIQEIESSWIENLPG